MGRWFNFIGGVGFDINCGVRMVALECSVDDIPNLDRLANGLNGRIPSGVLEKADWIYHVKMNEIISRGTSTMVDLGFAYDERCEKHRIEFDF